MGAIKFNDTNETVINLKDIQAFNKQGFHYMNVYMRGSSIGLNYKDTTILNNDYEQLVVFSSPKNLNLPSKTNNTKATNIIEVGDNKILQNKI